MAGFNHFGDSSRPREVAADNGLRQPHTVPLGTYTGAPPRTRLFTSRVGATASEIVPATRENRFVTLTAPAIGFSIYIGDSGVNTLNGLTLPSGIPYEVSLPGNQGLWVVTDAPVLVSIRVQVAAALAGDLERRM